MAFCLVFRGWELGSGVLGAGEGDGEVGGGLGGRGEVVSTTPPTSVSHALKASGPDLVVGEGIKQAKEQEEEAVCCVGWLMEGKCLASHTSQRHRTHTHRTHRRRTHRRRTHRHRTHRHRTHRHRTLRHRTLRKIHISPPQTSPLLGHKFSLRAFIIRSHH